jgi:hypothetical protein
MRTEPPPSHTPLQVGLPKLEQRVKILQHYIMKHDYEVGGGEEAFMGADAALMSNRPTAGSGSLGAVDWIAQQTDGFSGSDLAELCSQAAQQGLADFWEKQWWVCAAGGGGGGGGGLPGCDCVSVCADVRRRQLL